jgi:hypothetical protein
VKSNDVTAILKTVGLPVYYIYPQESISKTVPCLTYLLDKRGCEGEPNCKTTITTTLYCSVTAFDGYADTMEEMIYALPCLDRANVRRVDQYELMLDLAKCTWTIPIQG